MSKKQRTVGKLFESYIEITEGQLKEEDYREGTHSIVKVTF